MASVSVVFGTSTDTLADENHFLGSEMNSEISGTQPSSANQTELVGSWQLLFQVLMVNMQSMNEHHLSLIPLFYMSTQIRRNRRVLESFDLKHSLR